MIQRATGWPGDQSPGVLVLVGARDEQTVCKPLSHGRSRHRIVARWEVWEGAANMATLIDWSQLETRIGSYRELYQCHTDSEALAYVVLEQSLDLSPDEIRDAITDGAMDRGIDAVYVDDRDGKNVVHLCQVKHATEFDGAKRNFPGNEVDKLLTFVADLVMKRGNMQESCNPMLWEKVQEIWEAFERGTPSFVVHLCGNMEGLAEHERNRLVGALEQYRYFTVQEHTLASIVASIIESGKPRIDGSFMLVDKQYFERIDGNIRGLIATVPVSELIRLIRDPKDPSKVGLDVFNDNVRVYLSSKNRINKMIIASALSDENAEFWYLNNGITLTCDSFSYPPGVRGPRLEMKNLQIVNGGQTSNALFEAYARDPAKMEDVLILVRVYETKQRAISQKIAESTNSQTPIHSRDLRANDDIQKKLEVEFRDLGYFYERKKKQHPDEDRAKCVDAQYAAQAYLAYCLGDPVTARTNPGKIFSDLYDHIFNDQITARRLLAPIKVFEPVNQRKQDMQRAMRRRGQYEETLTFLVDGAYHVLYAIGLLCDLRELDNMDVDAAVQQTETALRLVGNVVDHEKAGDTGYSHTRFFKSLNSKRAIERTASRFL